MPEQFPTLLEMNADELLRELPRLWNELVDELDNQPNVFLRGRKVDRIPSSSADVLATDQENDFNWDASHIYVLIDNSGLSWRRTALSTF